jgi:tripartite-type tricarboxylate transporter receptor subunit TctC
MAAYPARPVRYVVPFGPGPTAAQARWLAERLGAALGQPVVVENVPGASGAAGTAQVARAAPDGYTLLAANPGPLVVGPHLARRPQYDAARDFEPIVLIATVSSVIAARPSLPAGDLAGVLARARRRELKYGSPGTGTVGHLAMELLQQLAGVALTHVPCAGLSEAVQALEAGDVDLLMIPAPNARALAAAGRIRALAATRRRRIASWPGLPTADESGLPGFESYNWNGVAAPAGTPGDVVLTINAAVNAVLRSRAAAQYLGGEGYEIAGGTPDAFRGFLRLESDKWAGVVRRAGLKSVTV